MGAFLRRQDSDEAIVRRVLAGRRDDFGILVHRYLRAVHAVGCARTGNPIDADDAAQETFIKAYLSLDSLREPRCFGAWLLSIARNIAHNIRRAETRRAEHEREAVEALPQAAPPAEEEVRRVLHTQLDRLDEPARELLLLHYYAGKNTRELADLLNISRDAVKKRLQRAREALGELMVRDLQPAVEPAEPEERRAARIVAAVAGLHPGWTAVAPAAGLLSAFGLAAALKTAAVVAVVGLAVAWYAFSSRETVGERVAAASAEPTAAVQTSTEPPQASAEAPQAPTAAPEASASVPKTAVPAASATTGVIQGRVYDSDQNTPISDVDIELRGSGTPVIARSDAEGRYRAAGLPPGDYKVMRDYGTLERYPHCHDQEAHNVVLHAGETLTVDYPLSQGTVIAGRVIDEAGTPLAGVTVKGLTNQENVWRDGESDADGRFVVAGFEGPGTGFTVCASKSGYAMEPRKNLTVPAGGLTDLDLVMIPESTVSGTVVDAEGNPLADVGVDAWLPQGGEAQPQGSAVFTRAGGAFTLTGLYPGRFNLIITAPGSQTFSVTNKAADIDLTQGGHLRDLVLVYEAGGDLAISGRVLDTDGDPVKYVTVYLEEDGIFGSRSAQSDSDGAYRIAGLDPGEYSVRAADLSSVFQQVQRKDAVPAGSEGVDFVFDARVEVRGTVVDAATRQPLTDFEVTCDVGDRPDPNLSAVWQYRRVQDQEGRFEVDKLLPGDVTLYARALGYAQQSVRVKAKAGETVEGVTIPLSRGKAIQGSIRNKQGEPLPGAMVYLGPVPDQQYRSKCAVATAGPQGEFTLHVQPAPVQTLSAYHTEYAPAAIEVSLGGNEPAKAEFVLGTGGSIEGTLTQDGQPIAYATQPVLAPNVSVRVGGALFESAPIGEDGHFRIDGLMPGRADVSVYYQRNETWPPTMSRSLHLEADVREAAVTRVDLVVPTGTAALEGSRQLGEQGGQVSLHIPLATGGYLAVDSLRNPDTYSFTDLPAGPATLHVTVWDESDREMKEVQTYEITLVSNQTLRQDVVLP